MSVNIIYAIFYICVYSDLSDWGILTDSKPIVVKQGCCIHIVNILWNVQLIGKGPASDYVYRKGSPLHYPYPLIRYNTSLYSDVVSVYEVKDAAEPCSLLHKNESYFCTACSKLIPSNIYLALGGIHTTFSMINIMLNLKRTNKEQAVAC